MSDIPTHEYYRDQINSLNRIPSLPIIAVELMQITREDNFSVNQILPVIERDPPLAMKVLKIANSAYYGMRRKVESLRHALVVIGMKELNDLSLGFSVMKTLSDSENDSNLEWDKLWEHSSGVGHIAQLLQEKMGIQTTSSTYALGLLHDIGKIILYRLEPTIYLDVIEYAERERTSSHVAEQQLLGIDHMTIGAWVAEKWQLPVSICEAIRFHHHPDAVENSEIRISTALVQLANIIANLNSISFGTRFQRSILSEEEGWKILMQVAPKISEIDFERFVMEIEDEVHTIKDMVHLLGTE